MYVEGDYTITGQHLPSSVGAVATLDACRAAFEEEWPAYRALARPGYRIGYGVAGGMKNVGAGKGKIDDAGATLHAQGGRPGRAAGLGRRHGPGDPDDDGPAGEPVDRPRLRPVRHHHPGHRPHPPPSVGLRPAPDARLRQRRRHRRQAVPEPAPRPRCRVDRPDPRGRRDRRQRGSQPVVAVQHRGTADDPGRGLRARPGRGRRGHDRGRVHRPEDLADLGPGGPPDRAARGVPQLPDVRLRDPGGDRGRRRGQRPGRRPAGDRRPRRRGGDQPPADPRPADRQRRRWARATP